MAQSAPSGSCPLSRSAVEWRAQGGFLLQCCPLRFARVLGASFVACARKGTTASTLGFRCFRLLSIPNNQGLPANQKEWSWIVESARGAWWYREAEVEFFLGKRIRA